MMLMSMTMMMLTRMTLVMVLKMTMMVMMMIIMNECSGVSKEGSCQVWKCGTASAKNQPAQIWATHTHMILIMMMMLMMLMIFRMIDHDI